MLRKSLAKLLDIVYIFVGIVLLLVIGIATAYLVKYYGNYPRGYDIWYHLYRGENLYQSILKGTWYPLYDKTLYNGVQALRYWPPLSSYLLASLRFITSDILEAYLYYLIVLIVFGGCGFLIFGLKYHCKTAAIILGVLWFFVPENLRVLFGSGNLPRALVAAMLPWLFYCIISFLYSNGQDKNERIYLGGTSLFMCGLVFSHSGEASILLLVVVLAMILYGILCKAWKPVICIILALVIGYGMAGIWLYPSLQGGLVSMNDTQSMKGAFYFGLDTLNPMHRTVDLDSLYFGLSYFLISILGILCARRQLKPLFITAIIIYFGTTKSAFFIVSKLPGGSLLWMERFVSVVMGLVLLGILLWGTLKRRIFCILCLCMILDTIPSLPYVFNQQQKTEVTVDERIEEVAKTEHLDRLKTITQQRCAVLDLSSYASFVPFYLGMGESVDQTFGAAWQSAATANNIMMLNEALTLGRYEYLFDRCLELGNDTILIPVRLLKEKEKDVPLCKRAAELVGYEIYEEDATSMIFRYPVHGTFGTVTQYEGVAIGTSSSYISLLYPYFEETTDPCITNYSLEQLSTYKKIYLSGFTYSSREKAEQLLLELSDQGCEIYIDMSALPQERGRMSGIFDVTTQAIQLIDQLPMLRYNDKVFYMMRFQDEIKKWNTVFVSGGVRLGTFELEDSDVAFLSSKKGNIKMIGLNLVYYAATSGDIVAGELVDSIFSLEHNSDHDLPSRNVVPITIVSKTNGILICSDQSYVNTSLAFHDHFTSSQKIKNVNGLVQVSSGTTWIQFSYPYKLKATFISIGSTIIWAFMLILYKKIMEV